MARFLREFEQVLLLSLIQLGDEAYTASIGRLLRTRTGRSISPGAIYTALERLERRGLVTSRFGEPTPERGGKRKKYYRIEPAGRAALEHTKQWLARVTAPGSEAP